MRILQLISSTALLGAERVVCELAKKSNDEMHVCLLGADRELYQQFRNELSERQDSVHNVSWRGRMSIHGLAQLRDLVTRQGIEVIHSHGYKADIASFLVRQMLRDCGITVVASCHNWMLNTIRERIYKRIDLLVLKRFDGVVAISKEIFAELSVAGVGRKIGVIDNGIDLAGFRKVHDGEALRNSLGIPVHATVVGCVASLTPEKRHCDLINAVACLKGTVKDLKLVLVGDGPCRQRLEEMVTELGLTGEVIFLGHRSDARSLYHAFDLFALVSSKEGLPMALLEAMASGVPVVASAVGAIPTVVDSGSNGILVTPGSVAEVVAGITTMLTDELARHRYAMSAREVVNARYSSEAMCRAYSAFYCDAVSAR